MYYVISLDHHGGYQGIANKFKTLKEAKADIENDEDNGVKYIRMGRIGYRKAYNGEHYFCRVIVEIDMDLQKAKGKENWYDLYMEPDEYEEPEKYEEYFDEIDKVLDILKEHRALMSDWGDYED